MFYYLNEPKFGGETAFPIADNETIPENEVRHETQAAMLYDEHLVLQLLSANCKIAISLCLPSVSIYGTVIVILTKIMLYRL